MFCFVVIVVKTKYEKEWSLLFAFYLCPQLSASKCIITPIREIEKNYLFVFLYSVFVKKSEKTERKEKRVWKMSSPSSSPSHWSMTKVPANGALIKVRFQLVSTTAKVLPNRCSTIVSGIASFFINSRELVSRTTNLPDIYLALNTKFF